MKRMRKKRIIYALLPILVFVVLLSGCMNILAEDLYSLPRLSNEYLRLQAQIDDVLEQGAELSPPVRGINRQAIQMRELTGDGTNVILTFFSLPDDGMLNLYLFVYEGGDYALAEIIEVRGIAFDSVRFVDMDGDGTQEIAMGWQVSPMLRQLEIFSIVDFEVVSLARIEYIDFIDFDLTGDGNNDIIAITPSYQTDGIDASLYHISQGGELIASSSELLGNIETYIQILTGRLIDDTPAIFIESEVVTEEGYYVDTEIFIFYDNELIKTTLYRD